MTKHVRDQSWAVVDEKGMDTDGCHPDEGPGTMMTMLLCSRCVVARDFGARHALEAANLLLLGADSDSEAEESNN